MSGQDWADKTRDPFGSRRVDGRYVNPSGDRPQGLFSILKWAFDRDQGYWDEQGGDYEYAERPPERVHDGVFRATFVNHSTVLLQSSGLNIITDPIFAERASPLSWAGPKRVRPPGIRFGDLPPIDIVLLSHNHYDHMCRETLRRLAVRDAPEVVTPLGNTDVPREVGMKHVIELDWWQATETMAGLEVMCVPARHFSARGVFDRGKALWGGFYMRLGTVSVYFAGDTAWSEIFGEIRRRLGAPDFSLIPIGAYRPRTIMEPVHVTPAEAVRVHQSVGSVLSMAIHFGTFPLADDGQFEPIEDLHSALTAAAVPREEFRAPAFGEAWTIRTGTEGNSDF